MSILYRTPFGQKYFHSLHYGAVASNIISARCLSDLRILRGREHFDAATGKIIDEASNLISAGCEFVHEYNGVMIYRKRE